MVNNTRVWFGDKAWTSYTLELEFQRNRVTQQPFSFDAGVYVSVLASDYGNGYTLQLGASDGREHALHYEINNSDIRSHHVFLENSENERWYSLRIEVGEGENKIWLDDQLLFQFEDARHPSGGIALGNWSTSTQWKHLRVTNKQGTLLLDEFPSLEKMSRPENADGFDVEAVKQQIEQIENQIRYFLWPKPLQTAPRNQSQRIFTFEVNITTPELTSSPPFPLQYPTWSLSFLRQQRRLAPPAVDQYLLTGCA